MSAMKARAHRHRQLVDLAAAIIESHGIAATVTGRPVHAKMSDAFSGEEDLRPDLTADGMRISVEPDPHPNAATFLDQHRMRARLAGSEDPVVAVRFHLVKNRLEGTATMRLDDLARLLRRASADQVGVTS